MQKGRADRRACAAHWRRSARDGRSGRIVLALIATFVVTPAAHTDFPNDDALGLKSLDDGRLIDARRGLERVLAARPEPVDKVMLNGNIEQPYLPHHFPGMLAYEFGDCDDAKAPSGNPMNSRMIDRLNQVRQQEQRLILACQPR